MEYYLMNLGPNRTEPWVVEIRGTTLIPNRWWPAEHALVGMAVSCDGRKIAYDIKIPREVLGLLKAEETEPEVFETALERYYEKHDTVEEKVEDEVAQPRYIVKNNGPKASPWRVGKGFRMNSPPFKD